MTLTIEFVKDNLPTADQQLALFKEILESYQIGNINWISSLEEINYSYKDRLKRLRVCIRLNPYEAYNYGEKDYLLRTVTKLLEKLAQGIKREGVTTILEPQKFPYIYPIQQDNGIDLRGVIGVY